MKIAVVGSGAAGLMAAWLLQSDHDVTVFENASRPGGHAHTVKVDVDGRPISVELGAEFFFEEGYAGMLAMLDRLGVARQRESLGVSLTIDEGATTFGIPPRSPATLLSCLRPRIVRYLLWMRRLAAEAERVAAEADWSLSVGKLIERAGIPDDVARTVVIPLIASSWGVTREIAVELAAFSVVQVMGLRLTHQPHSFRLAGGLSSYVDALVADCPRVALRLSAGVSAVDRDESGLLVRAGDGTSRFDAVVLACDWNNSAQLCAGSPALAQWADLFGSFEDYAARVAVHREPSYMPANRRLWGTANFFCSDQLRPRTTVWSGKRTGTDVFRTWLRDGEPQPATTTHYAEYRHIVVTPRHPARQARLAQLQGTAGVYAAGMYTDGIDNHESAFRSAFLVANRISPKSERVAWFGPRVLAR